MAPRRGACAAAGRMALARRQLLSVRGRASCWRAGCIAVAATSPFSDRLFASTSTRLPIPNKVAVVGGGLTGLVTAHYLAMLLPATSHITVYEGSGRTGGWIDSGSTKGASSSATKEGAPEILEAGARMVAPQRSAARYDDLLLLELIDQLGLIDDLRVSNVRPSQYVYYPDHLVDVALMNSKPVAPSKFQPDSNNPNNLVKTQAGTAVVRMASTFLYWRSLFRWAVSCAQRVLREPVFSGIVPSMIGYMVPSRAKAEVAHARMLAASRAPGRYPPASSDESVGDHVTRMVGGNTAPAENLVSALMHGIYGGDVWRISVASSVFRGSWLNESVRPVFQLYDRQAKIAEMRRQQAARGGSERPLDNDDFPGQNDGEGGGIAGFPPLTPETLALARKYGSDGPIAVAMESDMSLLYDIIARMQERQERWEQKVQQKQQSANRTMKYEEEEDMYEASPVDSFGLLAQASVRWSQFGFEKGFGTLTDALTRSLRSRPNVTILANEPVTAVRYEAQKVRVVTPKTTADGEWYDRVVSTVASPSLFRLAGGSSSSDGLLPALRNEHAVTIQVVNLYYAEPGLHRPHKGFGYLIPQSVPLEQNPEGALGVIFDSDREIDLRTLFDNERVVATTEDELAARNAAVMEQFRAEIAASAEAEKTRGTKYTVMLGGHYWDGYQYPDDFPTPAEAVRMAEAVVQRHLRDTPGWSGEKLPIPIATRTKLCRECIPQHYVGHGMRMAAADADLKRAFGGRLAVAGGSFTATGPGVLPSVRSAYDVALRVAGRGYRSPQIQASRNETDMAHVGDTGLGRFADPATDGVVPVPRRSLPLRFNNQTDYINGRFVRDGEPEEAGKNA